MPTVLSSLRVRLLLLILFAVLPALGLILYTAWEERQNEREHVREDASQIAHLAVLQQEQLLEGARQTLVMLASLTRASDLQSLNPVTCRQALAGLLTSLPSYANFGLVLPSGDIVCSGVEMAASVNVADRGWFQRAMQSGDLAFGEYQVGRITGEQTINIGHPITTESGDVKGVAFVALRLSWLNELLGQIQLPQGSAISIIDRSGTVLARFPEAKEWTGRSVLGTEVDDTIKSGANGVSSLHGLDGVTRLYSFESIPGAGGEAALYTAVGVPEGVAFAAVEETLRRNLVALGVVALLAIAAAWIGSDRLVLARMRALLATTEKLQSGDLTARMGQRKDRTEFGRLAGSFDAMADALQTREQELRQTAAELSGRNEELESFTYSVSHDLKEPLRTLEAFSQFLLEDYADRLDDEGRDYLERIRKASVHMKSLIDDLLTLSRLSRQPVSPARVSVSEVVAGIREAMDAMFKEKNATLEVDNDLPDVKADAARVEQIFANLVVNGLKFNESDRPSVRIRAASVDNGSATFSVEDNGIGIDPEFHDRIFGVFQRLHPREHYEGTGAGLAIVKRAAEASGGRVWVESRAGAGAKFYVLLPIWTEKKGQRTKAA